MPQNVLLHFPLVDLVCLRQTVNEHTQRIIKLIHEYNDYLSECKVFSTSDKLKAAPLPLFFSEYPNQSDVSLKYEDIFSFASGSQLIENDRAVSRDIAHDQSDSVINRVKSFESNNFSKEATSSSEWRGNSYDNKGNLTSLSCPQVFPLCEEKKYSIPVSFETFGATSSALSNMKQREFVNESKNDVRKLNFFPPFEIKNVKMENNDTKVDHFDSFEEDEVMVIEVKKEKDIEVITIDEEEKEKENENENENENDCMPPLVQQDQSHNSAKQDPPQDIPKPAKTVAVVNPTPSRENWEVPPSLTPEISQPPCLLPEIMEPIYTPELSQPPLIFPEIDPPLWTFSVPSPMIYSEDAQPPILTPEVKSIGLTHVTDTSPLMSDALPPMLNTPDPLSLDLPTNTLVSREGHSTQVSEFVMASHQDSTSFKVSSEQPIYSENSTNHMTSLQQSELPFGSSQGVDLNDPFMITPKKTNDITKIKGWKSKQFKMENHKTLKCYGSNKKAETRKGRPNSLEQMEVVEGNPSKETTENAFVSDRLDKFLEGEADLNVDYEIPYLYAELGIKLTKDAVLSRPTVSEEEVKMLEKKYQMAIDLNDNNEREFSRNKQINKSLISKPKDKRGVKRKIKQGYQSLRTKKLVVNWKKLRTIAREAEAGQTLSLSPEPKQTRVTSQGISSCPFKAKDFNGKAFEGHGSTKLLGLALYPGPNAPLPKIVQHYLDDIRSYRNKVDRNWANFALSALVVPKRCKYGRMILPIQYTGETLSGVKESTSRQSTIEMNNLPPETHAVVNEVVSKLVDAVSKESFKQFSEVLAKDKLIVKSHRPARLDEPEKNRKKRQRTDEKTDKKGTNVTECKIVVKKVRRPSRVWCMEHNLYNCRPCGFGRVTRGGKKNESTEEDTTPEFFMMSSPLISDQDISSLLTQKLRCTRWKDVVVSDIDALKVIVPNALEFIKLNHVRESFLKKHIYIWYLRPHPNLRNKSRAFLTFSETSPVPYAIRLRPDTDKFEEMVPKVLKDMIMIKEENVDTEYVILHCNGKVWQIHGSLRYATDNSSPNNFEKDCLKMEEVFTPTYPPELEVISEAATRVIKEPAVRWWVVDLSQKFTTIVSKLDSKVRTMTKKSILHGLRTRFYGFLALNKTSTRVIWVHLFPKILPYVLIGPFKLTEPHGLVLKQGLKAIPFSYYTHLCKSPNIPLKKFINSVIAQVKEQERELKGLWLCDRQQVDKTCYLEVISKSSKEYIISMADYDVDVEHGYSLMSRINRDKRKVTQNSPRVKIYMYFNLFELGYLPGYLQGDIVFTKDPINNKPVTLPLRSLAKWILGLIQDKISFLPTNTSLKCFITKRFGDLKERPPFNAKYLSGHYMICEVGPYSVLKLVNLRPRPSDAGVGASERSRIRRLEYILYGAMSGTNGVNSILTRAEMEIRDMNTLSDEEHLFYKRLVAIKLGARYIHMLESLECDDSEKIMLFSWIKDLFDENEQTDIDVYCKDVLRLYKFGRLYLILKEARDTMEAENRAAAAAAARIRVERMERNHNRGNNFNGLPYSVDEVSGTSGGRREEHSVVQETAGGMSSETTTIPVVETLGESSVGTVIDSVNILVEPSEILILHPPTYIVTNDNIDDNNAEDDNIHDDYMEDENIDDDNIFDDNMEDYNMEDYNMEDYNVEDDNMENDYIGDDNMEGDYIGDENIDYNMEGDNIGDEYSDSSLIGFLKIERMEPFQADSSAVSINPGDLSVVNFTNAVIIEDEMPDVETIFWLALSNYLNTFSSQGNSIMLQGLIFDLPLLQEEDVSVVGGSPQNYDEISTIEEPDYSEMDMSPQDFMLAPDEEGWYGISEPVGEETADFPTDINTTSYEDHVESDNSNEAMVFVPDLSVTFDLVDELYNHPIVSKLL